ncbi:hypothetical protein CDD82_3539 [Ophiocordyceps australis]|uniref:D-lactate dehydrogenase n=1 Tax=Ophiocordyceps australis TaxID=1399860 RepID=A0A2C5ZDV9_9HYPO|nr:hypothetical protein CDD82_3539 [Ophiocordyceps australis]
MRLHIFSAKPYDKQFLSAANSSFHLTLQFHDFPLNLDSVWLARGADAVCVFVNDSLPAPVMAILAQLNIKAILLRCAGYNNVDLAAARAHSLVVANVPSYSPEGVAEFAVALIQTLNRRVHRAYNRVREANFSLTGLIGRTLHGKTVGIIGTGRIGLATVRIMRGFGCRVLAYDPFPDAHALLQAGGEYLDSLDALLPQCDIVSLHCPLTDSTRHIINPLSLAMLKPGAMLVNTSRGGLVDTNAVIDALKSKHLSGLALDVYEAEDSLFYEDHSADVVQDDAIMRLTTFHNVLVCGHQAFFTQEALEEIAQCTLRNATEIAATGSCTNSLTKDPAIQRRGSFPVRTV